MKIMEVLGIKPNYKENKASIKLGDTSFASFTKKFNSVPLQTALSMNVGDYLGYEAIHDLYLKQKALFDRLELFRSDLNAWAASKSNQYGRGTVPTFSPGLALPDYRNQIALDTEADWSKLTTFIQPEKDLYRYTKDAEGYYITLQNYFKEWSRSRRYGSNTTNFHYVGYSAVQSYNTMDWTWSSTVGGLSVASMGSADWVNVNITGMSNIPIGTTAYVYVHNNWRYYDEHDRLQYTSRTATITITRHAIDNDSYYSVSSNQAFVYYQAYSTNNAIATHFNTATPTRAWIQNRKIDI